MDPNDPQAIAKALMGQPDPYEGMYGKPPQGNVAGSLTDPNNLMHLREAITGVQQPTKEDLASGKTQIPSWQSAIPQAIGLGMQGQGMAPDPAALWLAPQAKIEAGATKIIPGWHNIVNDQNKFRGAIESRAGYKPGEVNVSTLWGPGPWGMGPGDTASLARALRGEYPGMTTIFGERSTGARARFAGDKSFSREIPSELTPLKPPFEINPAVQHELEPGSPEGEVFDAWLDMGRQPPAREIWDSQGNLHLFDDNLTRYGMIHKRDFDDARALFSNTTPDEFGRNK